MLQALIEKVADLERGEGGEVSAIHRVGEMQMADDATYKLGEDLINRIAIACKLLDIDYQMAFQRAVSEEIFRGFDKYEIMNHMILGGLIHPAWFAPHSADRCRVAGDDARPTGSHDL